MSNNDVYYKIKNYIFRPTVAIIRFYPKLYHKRERECLYNVRHRISMLRSHHLCVGAKFFLYPYGLGHNDKEKSLA
jgi:hypothetical protein